jgi:hypothetical protein
MLRLNGKHISETSTDFFKNFSHRWETTIQFIVEQVDDVHCSGRFISQCCESKIEAAIQSLQLSVVGLMQQQR